MKGTAAVLICIALSIIMILPSSGAIDTTGWSAEERLSVQYPSTAYSLNVAVSDGGGAIAAWDVVDQEFFRTSAWVAIYGLQTGWTSGSQLDGTSASSYIRDVCMNAEGWAAAAWVRDTGNSEYPVVAIYEPGVGWGQPVQLSNAPADRVYSLDVTISSKGQVMATWNTEVGTVYGISVSVYYPATGWSSAEQMVSSSNMQSDPMVGVDDAGEGLVVWRELVEVPGQTDKGVLWYSTYAPSSGWSAASIVNDDNVGMGSPSAHMDVDGQGRALLSYSARNDGLSNTESYAAYYDGNAWLPSVLLSVDDGVESACPDVSLTADGWGMVVWAQWDGSISQYQCRAFDNGAFGPIEIIPQMAADAMNWPYIDAAGGKHIIVTTEIRLDGEDDFHAYAIRYSPSTGWSEWERLDKNSLNTIYFLVRGGIDRNGNAVVAWISHDDGSNWNLSIMASSYLSNNAEAELQKEVGDLRGQLTLTLIAAVVAMVIAAVSLTLLFRRRTR